MSRRFEFVRGSSSKFYEVVVRNCAVTTTFGRIGTAGQTQTKQFANQAAAQKHADNVIGQKLAKGYVEQRAA
jgi:predicted DNA-binding WGR domain protein